VNLSGSCCAKVPAPIWLLVDDVVGVVGEGTVLVVQLYLLGSRDFLRNGISLQSNGTTCGEIIKFFSNNVSQMFLILVGWIRE